MQDHQAAHAGVSLQAFEQVVFTGLRAGEMNACVACCDRWTDGNRVALQWFDRDHNQIDQTYASLQADAARFANLLTARGIGPGDVVAGLLPRGAELLTVVLGTWRAGAVYLPIFTGFGPAAIEARIDASAAKLVVTDSTNRAKLDEIPWCPPILVTTNGAALDPADGDFRAEMSRQSVWFPAVARRGEDPFVLLFTSHATRLQPVALPLRSLLAAVSSLQIGIDPRDADIGWDVADPAWSLGLYFAVVRPLLSGQAAIACETDNVTPPANPANPANAARPLIVLPRRTHHLPAVAAWQHASAFQLAA
jgi:acetyl-CoA synthetase